MRPFLIFTTVLVFSSGYAQRTYVGVGGSYVVSSAYPSTPLVSLQIGGPTAPEFGGLEARAALDTILIFSNLSLDVFAPVSPLDAPVRLYLGGGPDIMIFAPLDQPPGEASLPVSFGLHGTAGLELRPGALMGGVRPFAELQPAAAFLSGDVVYGLRARAGLNLYF